MTTDFERAHTFTALWEGGYVNHPTDPGGETNLGVTKANWLRWCKAQGLLVKPMRALTPADVLPFYQAWFWQPLAAGLPWPLSAAIYDMSVNHGVGDGNPDDEGGDEAGATWMLWKARQLCPNGSPLEQALAACDAREAFYRGIVKRKPEMKVFMVGWMRRVDAQRAWLRANATPSVPPAQRFVLVDKGGKQADWNGRDNPYNTVTLGPELLAALDLAYPVAGGPWEYGGLLKIWRRQSGVFVLERLPK